MVSATKHLCQVKVNLITKVTIKIASGKAAWPPFFALEVRKPDSEAGAIEVHAHIEEIILRRSIPTD